MSPCTISVYWVGTMWILADLYIYQSNCGEFCGDQKGWSKHSCSTDRNIPRLQQAPASWRVLISILYWVNSFMPVTVHVFIIGFWQIRKPWQLADIAGTVATAKRLACWQGCLCRANSPEPSCTAACSTWGGKEHSYRTALFRRPVTAPKNLTMMGLVVLYLELSGQSCRN